MDISKPSRSGPTALDVRRIAVLGSGDLIAFLLFALIGLSSHGELAGTDAALRVLETAAPFMAGWGIAASFSGAFRADQTRTPLAMAGRTALGWLPGWLIGLTIRGLIRQSVPPVSFAL